MGIRDKLKRLERRAAGEVVSIPQQDGTAKKFPHSALLDAYSNFFDRLGAGEDAPPEHPLAEAARNSSDPWWRESIYAADEDVTAPIPDLSEGD
jgi:hypothetical protein